MPPPADPASLPVILAGPIVRRVEPDLACVWVALSVPRDVKLDVWLGPVSAGTRPTPEFSGKAKPTIRVGPNLYIALATVTPETGANFLPEKNYSYDLTLTPVGLSGGGDRETLGSLGLLKDRGKAHLALGYEEGRLPTFVLPPRELADLRVIHGSCRRPQVDIPDAMVWMDDLIRDQRDNPKNRPHQLFLTGDQIYADDVGLAVGPLIAALGTRLLGDERVPTRWPHLDKKRPTTFESVADWFPMRFRQRAITRDARFTTVDGENHLISLGDFAAHYLLVWNRELWPEKFPSHEDYVKQAKAAHDALRKHPALAEETIETLEKTLRAVQPPAAPPPPPPPGQDGIEFEKREEPKYKFPKRYNAHVATLEKFRDGLPRVRRALANIPTYMMYDDHEITDDWFLSAAWRDRVLTSPLGRTIFRNGLVAYALFQGWGNDPRALEDKDSPHSRIRDQVGKLIPTDDEKASFQPRTAAADAIERLLGLNGEKPAEAGLEGAKSEIARWHFAVGGPRHQVFVLDVRMRRAYKSRLSGPGNVSEAALKEQLPDKPLPPEIDAVIIVSGLTVLGPPVIDALLGPMLYRSFDLSNVTKGPDESPIPGLNPDAIEAWPNDDTAFEALLARAAPFRRVVFLSGDVHFGTSAALTYFKKGVSAPARFAQFTSSGLKNRFNDLIVNLDHSLAFMQRVATEGARMERLGWEKKDRGLITGTSGKKIRPALRSRLETSPVLLPTHGWPDGAASTESDWSWRMHVVEDTRAEAERPEMTRPVILVPGSPGMDAKADPKGFAQAAARHAAHLDRFVFGRRILFAANLGVVAFETKPDPAATTDAGRQKLLVSAVHELHSALPEDARSQVYMRHVVPLDAPDEKAPRIGPAS